MRITIFRRLRKDRRGVSNIIVVALSLVIMLAIVSDIVLWNYEMTQVDWEKMKENVAITNTQSATNPSWLTVQTEFTLNTGTKTSGTYTDTTTIDGNFESFTEAGTGGGAGVVTLIDAESFEGSSFPFGWSSTGNWQPETDYAYDGSYSADFDGWSGGRSGYLYSPVMDCSDATAISIDFWWYDEALEDDEFYLQYYNGSTWNTYQDLNQLESEDDQWHHYLETITDSQYFVSNFRIRWWANSIWRYKTACVDLVTVEKSQDTGTHSFDAEGHFVFDLSVYQGHIQTIELQLMFRASDASENWYLQAYNWSSSVYSDSGFNLTAGHTPTTGWDYYTVNFTNAWQDYVDGDGTVNVRLVDQGGDSKQTKVDIDFLGINVQIDGTKFTFENEGSLTVRLVSLWITTSTDHRRYDLDVLLNSGATKNYVNYEVEMPTGNYIVKVVTERGNTAVFSGN